MVIFTSCIAEKQTSFSRHIQVLSAQKKKEQTNKTVYPLFLLFFFVFFLYSSSVKYYSLKQKQLLLI